MKYLLASILLIASIITHFAFFGYPKQVVFDELYFGKFALTYQNHQYYFDVHPPLAKLLIGGAGYLADIKPDQDFGKIGAEYSNSKFFYLRLIPTLAGTLLPVIIFFLCLLLGFKESSAFFAGLLVILENSLLTNSRFILPDSLLLFFGFGGLTLYLFSSRLKQRWIQNSILILSTIFLTFSLSGKWTGATFLFLVILIEIWRFYKKTNQLNGKSFFKAFSLFVILPFIVYFALITLHDSLLYKTGDGDAFMTPGFQKTLEGNSYQNDPAIVPVGTVGKFFELNEEMYNANKTLTATHPYQSKWYSWPFMKRPIYFWNQGDTNKIYLMGNPAIYWLSTIAIFFILIRGIASIFKRRISKNKIEVFLTIAFLINLLPFAPISRALFIYHYFTALVFAVIALAWLIEHIQPRSLRLSTGITILVLSAILFLYFAPFSYGLPLSQQAQQQRFWFSTWQ